MATRAISDVYHAEEGMFDSWVSRKATGRRTMTRLGFAIRKEYAAKVVRESRTDPAFEIPRFKLTILQLLVQRRKEAHSKHKQKLEKKRRNGVTPPDEIARLQTWSDGHLHAIRAWQAVFDEVRRGVQQRVPTIPATAPSSNVATNPYSILGIEGDDTDQGVLSQGAPAPALPAPAIPGPAVINDEDAAQRVLHFLEKAYDIRTQIRDAWERYTRGDLSLSVVAHMTEAAINLIKISHCDIDSLYESPECEDDLERIIDEPGSATDMDWTDLRSEDDIADGMPLRTPSGELLCTSAFRSLHWLRNTLLLAANVEHTVDTSISNPVPYPNNNFGFALIALAGDLVDLLKRGKEIKYDFVNNLDAYTVILLDIAANYKFKMWHVCATQIHHDIFEILQGDMARGFCEGTEAVWFRDLEFKDYLAQRDSCDSAAEYLQSRDISRIAVQEAIAIEQTEGPRTGWLVSGEGTGSQPSNRIFLRNELLRALPLLPIHQARRMLVMKQKFAAELYNRHFNLLACMYLYRAEQQCNGQRWHDMDFVLQSQANESAFKLASVPLAGRVADLAAKFTGDLGVEMC